MKKHSRIFVLMLVAMLIMSTFVQPAMALTQTKLVTAYSITASNVWGSISCDRSNYKVVGTAFGGPATQLTVRPRSTSGQNAANASTFSATVLTNGSGGKAYFTGYGPGSVVNLWGNSNVTSYPASLNATWYF